MCPNTGVPFTDQPLLAYILMYNTHFTRLDDPILPLPSHSTQLTHIIHSLPRESKAGHIPHVCDYIYIASEPRTAVIAVHHIERTFLYAPYINLDIYISVRSSRLLPSFGTYTHKKTHNDSGAEESINTIN